RSFPNVTPTGRRRRGGARKMGRESPRRPEHPKRAGPDLDGDLGGRAREALAAGVDRRAAGDGERDGAEAPHGDLRLVRVPAEDGLREELEDAEGGERSGGEAEVEEAVVGPGVRGEPEPAADGGAVADGGEEERAVVDPLARRAVVRAADLDVRLRPEPERSEHGGEVAGTAAEPLEPRRLRRRERVEPHPDGVDEGGLAEQVVGGLAPADDP